VLSALVTRPFTFHTRAPDGSQSLVAVWLEPEAAEASLHLVAARGAPRAPAEVAVLPWRLPDGGRLLAARFPVTSATAEVTLELRRKVVVASRTVGPAASVRVRGPGGPSSRR
jgi:hypothetical protein